MTSIRDLSNEQLLALAGVQPSSGQAQSSGNLFAGQFPAPQPQRPDPLAPQYQPHQQAPDYKSMSEAQLRNIAANANPNMSAAEDWARSGVSGAQQGVAGNVGLPGDFSNLLGRGATWAVNHAADALHLPNADKIHAAMADPNMQALLHMPTQGMGIPGRFGLGHMTLPTSDSMNSTIQQVAGPYHTPQTVGGDYARTIGQFLPAALGGGEGLIAKGGQVLIPAAASETAGQLTHGMGPKVEAAARVAGGLAGGVGAGALSHVMQPGVATVGEAAEGLTPAHIQAAQALRVDAAQRGINLTVPEAVQQVTNNGTQLGRLQRTVESSRAGGHLTAPYFAQRPGQVQQAVAQYLDTLAPATDQPSMVGLRVQKGADTALDRARQAVNKVAEPDYKALATQEMDPHEYAVIAQRPSYGVALKALRDHPELGAPFAGLPDNNMSVVNAVMKRLGTTGKQAKGTQLIVGDNELAASRFSDKDLADAIARQASTEFGSARDTVSSLSQAHVDPLRAGPLGAMSVSQDVPTQAAALYPAQALEGAPAETTVATRLLNLHAPGSADALTRLHLAGALDRSMRDLQTGPNQYAGSKFAVDVAGRPEQAATLHAGISELPEGAAKSADLGDLLEALRATGKRQQVGSTTAEKSSDLSQMGVSPAVKFATTFDIARPLDFLGEAMKGMNTRRNATALAQAIMADPSRTSEILNQALAAARPNYGNTALTASAGSTNSRGN